jgi:hypothetical protein
VINDEACHVTQSVVLLFWLIVNGIRRKHESLPDSRPGSDRVGSCCIIKHGKHGRKQLNMCMCVLELSFVNGE